MGPDFSRKTVDTVAKRAAFLCSNPDCRVLTVGPNEEPTKATVIGEAAHIFGARESSARYRSDMTDVARSEITNAIWLCKNCHRIVDQDFNKYVPELLFLWREEQEKFSVSNLGSSGDRMLFQLEQSQVDQLRGCPPIVRRIAIDRPKGWEWRLTAELLRHYNQPVLRRLSDLDAKLYTKPIVTLRDEEFPEWLSTRVREMEMLIHPISNTMSLLNQAWGEPGQAGDVNEIHHACQLMRDALGQVVLHEENLYFVKVSELYEPILELLKNALGNQARKVSEIPVLLDEAVDMIGADHGGTRQSPKVIQRTIVFDLGDGWPEKLERELKKVERELIRKRQYTSLF